MIHFERDAPFTIQVYWWDVVRSLGHSGTFFRSRNGSVRGHRRLQSAWGQPKVVLTQFRVAVKFIRDWASFQQAAAAFVSRKGDIQDKRMRKPKKLRLSKLEPNRYSRTKDIQRSVSLKKAVHPCKKTTFNTGEYGFFTRMQAFWGSHFFVYLAYYRIDCAQTCSVVFCRFPLVLKVFILLSEAALSQRKRNQILL